jgi:hypothetical protein
MEKFNLQKLKEVENKEQYRVEISNRFAAVKHLDTEVDINIAWETIRESIKISSKESLGQRWLTGGPRAGSGPQLDLLRPPPRFCWNGESFNICLILLVQSKI